MSETNELQLNKSQIFTLASFLSKFSPSEYQELDLDAESIEILLQIYVLSRNKQLEFFNQDLAELKDKTIET